MTTEDEDTRTRDSRLDRVPLTDPIAETLEGLRRRGFGSSADRRPAVNLDEVDRAALRVATTLEVIVDRLRIEGDLRTD